MFQGLDRCAWICTKRIVPLCYFMSRLLSNHKESSQEEFATAAHLRELFHYPSIDGIIKKERVPGTEKVCGHAFFQTPLLDGTPFGNSHKRHANHANQKRKKRRAFENLVEWKNVVQSANVLFHGNTGLTLPACRRFFFFFFLFWCHYSRARSRHITRVEPGTDIRVGTSSRQRFALPNESTHGIELHLLVLRTCCNVPCKLEQTGLFLPPSSSLCLPAKQLPLLDLATSPA